MLRAPAQPVVPLCSSNASQTSLEIRARTCTSDIKCSACCINVCSGKYFVPIYFTIFESYGKIYDWVGHPCTIVNFSVLLICYQCHRTIYTNTLYCHFSQSVHIYNNRTNYNRLMHSYFLHIKNNLHMYSPIM